MASLLLIYNNGKKVFLFKYRKKFSNTFSKDIETIVFLNGTQNPNSTGYLIQKAEFESFYGIFLSVLLFTFNHLVIATKLFNEMNLILVH